MLELALINYAMRFYQSRGYLPVTCPDLVRTHIAESCGFQPRDATSQVGDVQFTQTCLLTTLNCPPLPLRPILVALFICGCPFDRLVLRSTRSRLLH